jgi:cardiolipin synthase
MKEGVDVRIIYDDMGSRVLSLKTRKLIKKSGGQIRVFNKLLSRFTFSLNYRDHRKIIVIDGRVAYTGGCNLADEYINEKRMHGYWKDAGLRMTGEGVDALTLTFLRQWEFIVRKNIQYEQFLNHWEKAQSTSTVIPYVGGPEFEQPICKSVYENVITSAKRKLYIMTPYFVPDESIMQDIVNAALSGVDVRLVLPAIPDKLYVYLLTRDNAEKLTKYGVKVYYVEDAFVHSKVVLSESCAIIGSANFDMRSFFQQFENCVLTDDNGLMGDVERDFEQVFADSLLVEKQQKRGLFNAIAVSALRLVGPLM